MDVITTVLFDGQFWIALIEKIDIEGNISVGKYTFGPEPKNNDLIFFYLEKYSDIRCYKSLINIRVKKNRTVKEENRITSKSKESYKKLQSMYLHEKKAINKVEDKNREKAKYQIKQVKKKEKHKGH